MSTASQVAPHGVVPREITTIDELDALPLESLVLDAGGGAYRKREMGGGPSSWLDLDMSAVHKMTSTEESRTLLWQTLDGPRATVVYIPGAPIVGADRAVTDAMVSAADDAMLYFRSGTQHELIRAILEAAEAAR